MNRRRELLTIGGITALAFLCRLAALFQPMRYDESVTWAYYVGRSVTTITGTYTYPNNHVFYSLLAKLIAAPASYSPWALRLPAFIIGVAIIPLTWLVGKRFVDVRTGLLAAALAAGSTHLVLYSTNARGYTLIVALFLALLVVSDQLRLGQSHSLWVWFVMLGAVGFYTIPVMFYPFGVAATWLGLGALRREKGGRLKFVLTLAAACVTTILVAAMLYSPIIRAAGLSAVTGNKFVTPSTWEEFTHALIPMMASTLGGWTRPMSLWATPALVIVALIGIAKRTDSARPSLALAALIWCAALLLAMHRTPFDRVWLFLLPLFLIAVSRGVWIILDRLAPSGQLQVDTHNGARRTPAGLASMWIATAAAVLMVGGEMMTKSAEETDDTGMFRPAEQVAALLAPRLKSTDRVLAPTPSLGPLLYYFPRFGADTALLTIPMNRVNHAYLVLDTRHGQTLDWAVERKIIHPQFFTQPTLVARYAEGEVWETFPR